MLTNSESGRKVVNEALDILSPSYIVPTDIDEELITFQRIIMGWKELKFQ